MPSSSLPVCLMAPKKEREASVSERECVSEVKRLRMQTTHCLNGRQQDETRRACQGGWSVALQTRLLHASALYPRIVPAARAADQSGSRKMFQSAVAARCPTATPLCCCCCCCLVVSATPVRRVTASTACGACVDASWRVQHREQHSRSHRHTRLQRPLETVQPSIPPLCTTSGGRSVHVCVSAEKEMNGGR